MTTKKLNTAGLDAYITGHEPKKSDAELERELEQWYNAAEDDIDEMQIERCDE